MRKLIFQEFLSLDGYAADKDHSTQFFEDQRYSAGSDTDLLQEMDRFDTILLGATTYRMFAEYWPEASNEEQIVADKLNSIPKVVFSSTLTEAPWGKWEPATIVRTAAIDTIKKMKADNGKDMVLWGSISLAQALIKENCIDEYQLRIVPVILGGGTLLFTETSEIKLRLLETKFYQGGLVYAAYAPA